MISFKNLIFILITGSFATFGFSGEKHDDHSKDKYHCTDKKDHKKHLKASTKEACEKDGGNWEKHHSDSSGKEQDHDHSH